MQINLQDIPEGAFEHLPKGWDVQFEGVDLEGYWANCLLACDTENEGYRMLYVVHHMPEAGGMFSVSEVIWPPRHFMTLREANIPTLYTPANTLLVLLNHIVFPWILDQERKEKQHVDKTK